MIDVEDIQVNSWICCVTGLAEQFGNALEILDGFRAGALVGEHFDHLLDGHGAIGEVEIFGQVDRSHAAAADAPDDLVAVDQQCSTVELNSCWRIARSDHIHSSGPRRSRRRARVFDLYALIRATVTTIWIPGCGLRSAIGTEWHSLITLILTQDEFEKRFADDDLIAVVKRLLGAGQQTRPAIDKSPVRTAQILDQILVVQKLYSGVTARNLGFGVILIQINVRKDAAISVPATDHRLGSGYRKLFSDFASTLNDQSGSRRRDFFVTHNFLISAIGATQRAGLPVERRGLIHHLSGVLRCVRGRFRRAGRRGGARSPMRRLIQPRRLTSIRGPTGGMFRSLLNSPTRGAY